MKKLKCKVTAPKKLRNLAKGGSYKQESYLNYDETQRQAHTSNPLAFKAMDTMVYPGTSSMMDKEGNNIGNSFPEVDRELATVEAEKGELILTANDELYKINGKPHSKDGTPIQAGDGDFIFSNKILIKGDKLILALPKLKPTDKRYKNGMTPAALAKAYLDMNTHKANLEAEDPFERKTATRNIESYKKKLSEIAFLQEEEKGFDRGFPQRLEEYVPELAGQSEPLQEFKRGGIVKYQKGGEVVVLKKGERNNNLPEGTRYKVEGSNQIYVIQDFKAVKAENADPNHITTITQNSKYSENIKRIPKGTPYIVENMYGKKVKEFNTANIPKKESIKNTKVVTQGPRPDELLQGTENNASDKNNSTNTVKSLAERLEEAGIDQGEGARYESSLDSFDTDYLKELIKDRGFQDIIDTLVEEVSTDSDLSFPEDISDSDKEFLRDAARKIYQDNQDNQDGGEGKTKDPWKHTPYRGKIFDIPTNPKTGKPFTPEELYAIPGFVKQLSGDSTVHNAGQDRDFSVDHAKAWQRYQNTLRPVFGMKPISTVDLSTDQMKADKARVEEGASRSKESGLEVPTLENPDQSHNRYNGFAADDIGLFGALAQFLPRDFQQPVRQQITPRYREANLIDSQTTQNAITNQISQIAAMLAGTSSPQIAAANAAKLQGQGANQLTQAIQQANNANAQILNQTDAANTGIYNSANQVNANMDRAYNVDTANYVDAKGNDKLKRIQTATNAYSQVGMNDYLGKLFGSSGILRDYTMGANGQLVLDTTAKDVTRNNSNTNTRVNPNSAPTRQEWSTMSEEDKEYYKTFKGRIYE